MGLTDRYRLSPEKLIKSPVVTRTHPATTCAAQRRRVQSLRAFQRGPYVSTAPDVCHYLRATTDCRLSRVFAEVTR